jgi:hypothetical protein
MLGVAGFPLLGLIWVKVAIILTYVGLALRYAWINIPKNLSLPPQEEHAARAARHSPEQE